MVDASHPLFSTRLNFSILDSTPLAATTSAMFHEAMGCDATRRTSARARSPQGHHRATHSVALRANSQTHKLLLTRVHWTPLATNNITQLPVHAVRRLSTP